MKRKKNGAGPRSLLWELMRVQIVQAKPNLPFRVPKQVSEARFLFPPDPALSSEADLEFYLLYRFLPWRLEGRGPLIAAADTSPGTLGWLHNRYDAAKVVPIDHATLNGAIVRMFGDRLVRDASFALEENRPGFSARRVVTRTQAAVAAGLALALVAASAVEPGAMLRLLTLTASAGFVFGALVRLALAASRPRSCPVAPASDADLPVYTVLVPVFRESEVLPQLAAALDALDYPRDRLDITFVVEEDDVETRRVAEQLSAGGRFETVVVPACLPRTKPKALNFALAFARGEFLAVYDAEDRPEPDQLLKAVARFRAAPDDVVCLQARLAVDNAAESWISTMFSVDYDVWFSAVLPALARIDAPMPLGGTSNHFRTASLKAAVGWDPFNVTEDADLGIRLARLGGKVAMLDSRTLEEAPTRLPVWFGQHTRWLKGYMQTILVHLRDPAGLAKAVGGRGTVGFAFFLGGAVWSALVNPLLWLIGIGVWIGAPDDPVYDFALAAGLCHLAANATLVASVLLRKSPPPSGKQMFRLAGVVFYWLAISAAAWNALWQLVRRPHHWEKTPHRRRE